MLRQRSGRPLVSQRINAERIVLFGWSRAILLQLAHPLVAAGVADHSSFRSGPLTAASRLHHTIRAMLALTFGTDAQRAVALEGIRGIHRRVNGTLRHEAGRWHAGTRYSAEDPALVLWVHATLLDSVPRIYELLVEPLTDADRDAYCAEAASTAVALGAEPDQLPRTIEAARRYMDGMLTSGTIAVSPDAKELSDAVLSPPLRFVTAPAARLNRIVTIGLLPDALRQEYGFTWTRDDAGRFDRYVRLLRTIHRYTPQTLARWPEARRAPA